MVVLFLVFGWGKMTNFAATVSYFATLGVPMPLIATLTAILSVIGLLSEAAADALQSVP